MLRTERLSVGTALAVPQLRRVFTFRWNVASPENELPATIGVRAMLEDERGATRWVVVLPGVPVSSTRVLARVWLYASTAGVMSMEAGDEEGDRLETLAPVSIDPVQYVIGANELPIPGNNDAPAQAGVLLARLVRPAGATRLQFNTRFVIDAAYNLPALALKEYDALGQRIGGAIWSGLAGIAGNVGGAELEAWHPTVVMGAGMSQYNGETMLWNHSGAAVKLPVFAQNGIPPARLDVYARASGAAVNPVPVGYFKWSARWW
jgi:hypothetical protein